MLFDRPSPDFGINSALPRGSGGLGRSSRCLYDKAACEELTETFEREGAISRLAATVSCSGSKSCSELVDDPLALDWTEPDNRCEVDFDRHVGCCSVGMLAARASRSRVFNREIAQCEANAARNDEVRFSQVWLHV